MMSKKSPGGSIFPYYYKNGELFGAHYESFAGEEERFLQRIHAEEKFFLEQNRPLPYWVNFYGTRLSTNALQEFILSLSRLQRIIPKLAVVGCSAMDRWRIERLCKKRPINIPIRYFSDPEEAKTWLVSEG